MKPEEDNGKRLAAHTLQYWHQMLRDWLRMWKLNKDGMSFRDVAREIDKINGDGRKISRQCVFANLARVPGPQGRPAVANCEMCETRAVEDGLCPRHYLVMNLRDIVEGDPLLLEIGQQAIQEIG